MPGTIQRRHTLSQRDLAIVRDLVARCRVGNVDAIEQAYAELDIDVSRAGFRLKSQRRSETELTDREREVFDLIADGLSSDEIAAALGMGRKTVNTHVSNIIEKLGARNRVHAVALMLRRELAA